MSYQVIVSNEICNHIWEMIKCKSQKAILEKGIFYIGFSGGSLPKIMAKADMCTGIEFDKWRVFFTDERLVPNDHNDSNFKNCNDALFSKLAIPAQHVYQIDASLSTKDAAKMYENKMNEVLKGNDFDVLLLGMGPDGHTASLFPNHELLNEFDCAIASIEDSPKLPLKRITMTYKMINAAENVAFVASGSSKKEVLQEIIGQQSEKHKFPAGRVMPRKGDVYWFLDKDAGEDLPDTLPAPWTISKM